MHQKGNIWGTIFIYLLNDEPEILQKSVTYLINLSNQFNIHLPTYTYPLRSIAHTHIHSLPLVHINKHSELKSKKGQLWEASMYASMVKINIF